MKATSCRRLALAAVLTCALAGNTTAQTPKFSDDVVRIGVLTDLSGIYADLSGPGSVLAAKMAVEDFGKTIHGKRIEVVSADTLNKADTAANKAREWFDRDGVDMIVDLPASSVVLATAKVAQAKNKILIAVGSSTTRLTNEDCSPTVMHWAYDTYSLATATARAVAKQGGDSWYFLTADYAGGHALMMDAMAVVKQSGGKVLGESRHPFPGNDFSSYLLKAQASGAKVIGLANAGNDTVNSIKQAAEFGIMDKQMVVATLLFDTDVHSLGLKYAQGMYLTTGFYWDLNDKTRAFGKRFFASQKRMPTMVQAGVYSAVMHYLKAVKAAATDDSLAVAKEMKKIPVNDFFAENGKVREDGRMVHDMYLAQIKKPEESKYPWDYFHIRQVIKGDDAFIPLSKSLCTLVNMS
ncbi:ABC transporter substrate-binding protein [Noviherbaspirillum denitrificans]|uniref:ABC transporter permease n=1 Tax=Noviherbaspirillum denitrificans TaxID=1968433 RepID=A0A254TDM0_9BURK|nr:ABC transporter substrate-binding protein [Noviherbaspirillum denitrificans]OWW20645.1 ABC transporter permease [Noviherbaspirillum denitrificans]